MGDLLRTPVKKANRSGRKSKENTNVTLVRLQKQLEEHIGKPAILFIKEGREMMPYFVTLCDVNKKWGTAVHKNYGPNGKFRCHMKYSVSIVSLMTGDQKIIFFDEGI